MKIIVDEAGEIIAKTTDDHTLIGGHHLCVPKTLFELMPRWNRLSWRNDRAALFRSGRPGLAIQVEGAA